MTLVGFIPGPSYVLAEADDDRPTRWCFHCRRHLPHRWFLMTDPPERQPSYYEPVPVLRCERCDEDHTEFPGSYQDGPHYPESEAVCEALSAGARATMQKPEWRAIWHSEPGSNDAPSIGPSPPLIRKENAT